MTLKEAITAADRQKQKGLGSLEIYAYTIHFFTRYDVRHNGQEIESFQPNPYPEAARLKLAKASGISPTILRYLASSKPGTIRRGKGRKINAAQTEALASALGIPKHWIITPNAWETRAGAHSPDNVPPPDPTILAINSPIRKALIELIETAQPTEGAEYYTLEILKTLV